MKPHLFCICFFAGSLSLSAKDYGDAPASYGTRAADNGAAHGVTPALFMGNLGPDEEADGLPDAAALGDDLNNIDDEDALVNSSLIFIEGVSHKLTVECTNLTGRAAQLGVWIDWDRDGIFKNEAGEFAIADVPAGAVQRQIVVNLPAVPIGVVGGNPNGELSFVRLRLTTDLPALASPTGSAIDGEVEDWQIQLFENYDYGDLPDLGPGTGPGNYRTTLNDGGPRHRLGRPVYLGSLVDGEFTSQGQATALGDDNTGSPNDEDGARAELQQIIPGHFASLSVTATNETESEALLRAEVDLNQNGSFADPGERQTRMIPAGSTQQPVAFNFATPFELPVGSQLAARFRISTDPLMINDPEAATLNDGEVEDYFFTVQGGTDWGDLPDFFSGPRAGNFDRGDTPPDYQTIALDGGASHLIVPGLSIANDTDQSDVNVDSESNGQPGLNADADDGDGNNDDLALMAVMTRQQFISQPLGVDHSKLEVSIAISQAVENTTGAEATFYAFLDGNRDGDFEDPGERFTSVIPGDGSVTAVFAEFDVILAWPGLLRWSETFALRCRISSDPNLGANGQAPDGEVQDDLVRATLAISNPRPSIIDLNNPDPGELIQLTGEPLIAPLGVPLSLPATPFVPEGVENVENPIWSLHINGDIGVGGAINFTTETVNELGPGDHPVTLSFEDSDTGDLYVVRFPLRIVDLPGYAEWAEESSLPVLSNRLDLDPDSDGFTNLIEYAMGTRGDLASDLPATPLTVGNGNSFLTVSYPRREGGATFGSEYQVGDLVYRSEGSHDLVNWQQATRATFSPIGLPPLPENFQWFSFSLTEPISANPSAFLRVKIEVGSRRHR